MYQRADRHDAHEANLGYLTKELETWKDKFIKLNREFH